MKETVTMIMSLYTNCSCYSYPLFIVSMPLMCMSINLLTDSLTEPNQILCLQEIHKMQTWQMTTLSPLRI